MKVQTSETAVLVVFAVTLIGCILAGIPILAALALGYLIFFAYTLSRGYTVRDILGMSWKGIKTAKNILITFLLIGMLTALWRAAGTAGGGRISGRRDQTAGGGTAVERAPDYGSVRRRGRAP